MKYLFCILLSFLALIQSCKKHVKKSLPVLATAPVIIKANAAESGGTIAYDGGSPITQRGICWAEHTVPTISDTITKDGTGDGSFNSSFTGLKGNTTYYVRAYATNASGTGYGNELSFTTNAGLAVVATAEISAIILQEASTGGNVTSDGGAPVTERGIVYSLQSNPTTDNIKVKAGTGTGAFTTKTSTLGSEKDYYLRAYAINSNGTSYGNEIKFKSPSANVISDLEGNGYTYTNASMMVMTMNLKTTKYTNGDPIINGLTGFNWATTSVGAYTFPNGNEDNKNSDGVLYNLHAINDPRGVCPAGWHVPSDGEWKQIELFLGVDQVDNTGARADLGRAFATVLYTDPAGYFINSDSTFQQWGKYGVYWSSTQEGSSGNWIRANDPEPQYQVVYRNVASDSTVSVRCVKQYE